jgi:hypothetical protein
MLLQHQGHYSFHDHCRIIAGNGLFALQKAACHFVCLIAIASKP